MSTSFTPHTFKHPQLGPLTGRIPSQTPSIAHFRSIPFASIPARFRQSILLTKLPSATHDFTEYGTACPCPTQADEHAVVGGLLPGQEERKFGEFDCLNLTIAAPKDVLGDGGRQLLPVMVYVHGGAFKVGAGHVSAVHETTRLVNMSIREEHPVVIVSIHYRLNWQGFLACQDIIDEAKSNNEPPSNFGLYDQRNAFFWIQRFISGFGGDPKQITAFGESAGSGSIAMHMSTSIPLFNRAIMMSGTTATGPPVELKYKEAEYRALLKYCGIGENDPDRLKRLREVPVEKLVEATDGVGIPLFNSLRDNEFFTRGFPTWYTEDELIGNCEWVDEIMIGDTFFEGWIFSEALKHIKLDQFINLSTSTLGEAHATKILTAYEITPKLDANLFWTNLLYLMGDITFSEPVHKLCNALATNPTKKIYRYTETMRNPIPGTAYHQIPGHHFIEVLFLFGTLRERYPHQRYRDLSEEFGKRWLRFGVGMEPWDEYRIEGEEGDGKIMVVSGREGWVLKSRVRDEVESLDAEEGKRRYEGWETLTGILKDLAKGERGALEGEEARLKWGPDGGIFRLAGLTGPIGVVLP